MPAGMTKSCMCDVPCFDAGGVLLLLICSTGTYPAYNGWEFQFLWEARSDMQVGGGVGTLCTLVFIFFQNSMCIGKVLHAAVLSPLLLQTYRETVSVPMYKHVAAANTTHWLFSKSCPSPPYLAVDGVQDGLQRATDACEYQQMHVTGACDRCMRVPCHRRRLCSLLLACLLPCLKWRCAHVPLVLPHAWSLPSTHHCAEHCSQLSDKS
jgi:hypothetical protein